MDRLAGNQPFSQNDPTMQTRDGNDDSNQSDSESSVLSSSSESSSSVVTDRVPKTSTPRTGKEEHIPLGERLARQDELGGLKNALKRSKPLPKKKSKKSKHAPVEVSSRRRQKFDINASGLSVEIGKHRYQPKDPRQVMGATTKRTANDNQDEYFTELRRKEMKSLKQRIKAQNVTGKKGQRWRKKLGHVDVEEDSYLLQRLQTAKAADRHEKRHQAAVSAIREERGRHYRPKVREVRERLSTKSSSKKRRQKNKSKDASLFPI